MSFPLKIAPSHGNLDPASNTWFLGSTRLIIPDGISIGSAVFAGFTVTDGLPTDRQTDHATRSVTIHLVSKNVPPMASYNFDTHEQILIFWQKCYR